MQQPHKISRVSDAYIRLKEAIRNNELPPGFQASEPAIAMRLGMSRTPVREALIRLEAEGLVELIPRRGARVLPIRLSDMKEIYQILASLESDAAASLAAAKPSNEALRVLSEATGDMEAALDAADLDAWADADDRFHHHLLDMHGNRRLREFILALNDQVHRTRIVTLRLRGLPVQSTQEHGRILRCLQRGDAPDARATCRAHRERAARELLGVLEKHRITQL